MKNINKNLILLTLLVWIFTISLKAAVKPAQIFGSNMVLQQGQENPIWGWANKGEQITISFASKTISVETDKTGKWSAILPSLDYGGPYEMTIKGENTITFENILIGEVWICSGQSNMEWPVRKANNDSVEISQANYPNIRLFKVGQKVAQEPLMDVVSGDWFACTPENIPDFSAVAYFFGRNLNRELGVAIGLIQSAWGGTVAETWISHQTIDDDPDFAGRLNELAKFDVDKYKEELKEIIKEVPDKDSGLVDGVAIYANPELKDEDWAEINPGILWEQNGYLSIDGIGWYRKTVELNAKQAEQAAEIHIGAIDDKEITWINGIEVGATNQYDVKRVYPIPAGVLKVGENVIAVRVEDIGGGGGMYGGMEDKYLQLGDAKKDLAGHWKFKLTEIRVGTMDLDPNDYPTLLYNGMISPLIPYGIKGAIWYQGESNAERARQYQRVFPSLINDWRSKWRQGDFPFLFVSLANFRQSDSLPSESAWAELREAQTKTLALPNTGMALAIDIGDASDIHPKNKQDVGRRLALNALKIAYEKDIVHSGPIYESVSFSADRARITFKETGGGLVVKNKYGYVHGFAIAGADQKFVWAEAAVNGRNTVDVYSDEVPNPEAVRFGWADNPDDLNLYNEEGLPANPFQIDDWSEITE